MAKRFLRSVVQDFATLVPSADITPIAVGVNPVSYLILTLSLVINGSQAALNTFRRLTPFFSQINDVRVKLRGENIWQGSLQDVTVLAAIACGATPWGREFHGVNTVPRTMSFVIPFSRVLYWHEEGIPATRRGDLMFEMSAGATPAGFSTPLWALEQVELIEDAPTRFLKATTLTRAITASGRQRMDLPVGNDLLGLLMFDPSDEIDATAQYAFGKTKVLVDNVEQYVASSNWESNAVELARRIDALTDVFGHRHEQAAADTSTGEQVELTADVPPIQYGYHDFDPLKDGSYAIPTRGLGQFQLDLESDVNAGTVRVLPLELVNVGGATAAP